MSVLNVEVILFDVGLYYPLFAFLEWQDLVVCEGVSREFRDTIRGSEPTWRIASTYLFRDKVYIPPVVKRFLYNGNTVSERKDLLSMSIKELKLLARHYAVSLTTCFEKTDIVNALNIRETRKKLPNECLARFAVRYACIDGSRNTITEEELTGIEWNIRLREFGQLSHLLPDDPWWNGTSQVSEGTTTTIRFLDDGSFRFRMDGQSPYASMMPNLTDESQASFLYNIQSGGRSVHLSFGVSEIVFRHPTNWGFMMGSEASVWTGFPMPCRGKDPLIEDPDVEKLRQVTTTDFGMSI